MYVAHVSRESLWRLQSRSSAMQAACKSANREMISYFWVKADGKELLESSRAEFAFDQYPLLQLTVDPESYRDIAVARRGLQARGKS